MPELMIQPGICACHARALAAEAVPITRLYPEIVAQMSRIEKGRNI
jgi:hypothetical protein